MKKLDSGNCLGNRESESHFGIMKIVGLFENSDVTGGESI